ncbi:MAG: hypothetical protein M3R04_01245, partial [bacterium]|nr:hypothetical protein [bacterium]
MRFLSIAIAYLLSAAPAAADVPGISVTLESGEVVGQTRGLGTATLTARVANGTARTLDGIRLVAWYSPVDVFPTSGADWRVHEFVFDPPLASGASGTLTFSDDNAAQYVQLLARQVKFRPALRYDDVTKDLKHPLLTRAGATHVALRDLADVIGSTLHS